jgi:hypothetical protein
MIDSGAPNTVINPGPLEEIGAESTGEYFYGRGGGCTVPSGYDSLYIIDIESECCGRHTCKVARTDGNMGEYEGMLGMDWLSKVNPRIDHRRNRVYPESDWGGGGGRRESYTPSSRSRRDSYKPKKSGGGGWPGGPAHPWIKWD